MNKQPKLLDVSLMRDIFKNNFSQICQNLFFNDELAMIHGEPSFFQFIMQRQPPFVINDHRLGIITHGEGHINFNLMDRHLSAGRPRTNGHRTLRRFPHALRRRTVPLCI